LLNVAARRQFGRIVRMSDVTQILQAIDAGEADAAQKLLPLVYEELRVLAARRLEKEPPGQTIQPTALVHEAYLRLVGAQSPQHWQSKGHFFAAAAQAMRRILVENARRRKSLKQGGHWKQVDLDQAQPATPKASVDLVALDEALCRLAEADSRKARLVELRFFAGMTMEQAASALGVSIATAQRDWLYARAWLHRALAEH
jgi:RNA polymerase sigma factor (TIGR02999 family)